MRRNIRWLAILLSWTSISWALTGCLDPILVQTPEDEEEDIDAGSDESVDAGGCQQDADCDDGVFCNGAETCDEGVCTSPGDPCAGMALDGGASGSLSLVCDETVNACVGCVESADCASVIPSMPICEASICVECAASSDCMGNANGAVCDTSTHLCEECLSASDCSGNANGPACDLADQVCVECLGNGDCAGHLTGPVCDTPRLAWSVSATATAAAIWRVRFATWSRKLAWNAWAMVIAPCRRPPASPMFA